MKNFAFALAAIAVSQHALAQQVGPKAVLPPNSCLSTDPVMYAAPTTGYRCGNPVAPRMRYRNHATVLANSTLPFQACAASCVANDACKALTFESSSSSCTTYAHGGGYVNREPILVNPAPGFAFYNRHCFHELQCFHIQAQDAPPSQVMPAIPTNRISYNGDYVTHHALNGTNFAQFETSLAGDQGGDFYLLSDGSLVSDDLALAAYNKDKTVNNAYTTVYFPSSTERAAGVTYEPLACAIGNDDQALTCTSGDGSQFYGCSSAKTSLTGTGLALGLPLPQSDPSLTCDPVTLTAVDF